jgi:hypothetical protein
MRQRLFLHLPSPFFLVHWAITIEQSGSFGALAG